MARGCWKQPFRNRTTRVAASGHRLLLRSMTALASIAIVPPALAAPANTRADGFLTTLTEPHLAVSFAFVAGSAIFVLTTAVFYRMELRNWRAREAGMRAELAELSSAHDRAEILIGAESQIVVSWESRDAQPRIEGDPTTLGTGIGGRRILAFGSWLGAADASAIEAALQTPARTRRSFPDDAQDQCRALHRCRGPRTRRSGDPAPARRHRRAGRTDEGQARIQAHS